MFLCDHTYLSDASDVLYTILGGEAQVFVQAESHIVTVQSVSLVSEVEEVLFQSSSDGGFSRC